MAWYRNLFELHIDTEADTEKEVSVKAMEELITRLQYQIKQLKEANESPDVCITWLR